jgi:hypothetical protein
MLETGISSTQHSLRFWGIAAAKPKAARAVAEKVRSEAPRAKVVASAPARRHASRRSPAVGIQKTIEDALRAAGLLRG